MLIGKVKFENSIDVICGQNNVCCIGSSRIEQGGHLCEGMKTHWPASDGLHFRGKNDDDKHWAQLTVISFFLSIITEIGVKELDANLFNVHIQFRVDIWNYPLIFARDHVKEGLESFFGLLKRNLLIVSFTCLFRHKFDFRTECTDPGHTLAECQRCIQFRHCIFLLVSQEVFFDSTAMNHISHALNAVQQALSYIQIIQGIRNLITQQLANSTPFQFPFQSPVAQLPREKQLIS